MGKVNKRSAILKALENPENATLTVAKLAKKLGVSEQTLYRYRKMAKTIVEIPVVHKRKLQPKVTVSGVRSAWEKKYAALDSHYSELADKHIALAKKADAHAEAEFRLSEELENWKDIAGDRLASLHQQRGVIIYLEGKVAQLEKKLGNPNN